MIYVTSISLPNPSDIFVIRSDHNNNADVWTETLSPSGLHTARVDFG
jgi:hypothetical protein